MPRKANLYIRIKREAPDWPEWSCPHIDEAMEEMEEVRSINDRLRDCAIYYKDCCKDLASKIEGFQLSLKLLNKEFKKKNPRIETIKHIIDSINIE